MLNASARATRSHIWISEEWLGNWILGIRGVKTRRKEIHQFARWHVGSYPSLRGFFIKEPCLLIMGWA